MRLATTLALLMVALLLGFTFRSELYSAYCTIRGRSTVEDRLNEFGDLARTRMMPAFEHAGVLYPPQSVVLLAIKDVKKLYVYATNISGTYVGVSSYSILGASGKLGPKLQEGDRQVPEGVYLIESLNPNSRFHVSMRLNYPNETDRAFAKIDERANLGSDIFIHGRTASAGCLAMGDQVAEELFALAADVGVENIKVIIAPTDLRLRGAPDLKPMPEWTPTLYKTIADELEILPEWAVRGAQ